MSALPELRPGDRVLVRAEVFMVGTGRCAVPYLRFNAGETIEAAELDIACVETAHFKRGDTVIAEGRHPALILHVEDGYATLRPTGPNRTNNAPWIVPLSELSRPPAEKPSAELHRLVPRQEQPFPDQGDNAA